MIAFINANKTKLLGLALITVTFIQGDSGLVDLIGPALYAWVIRAAGLLALWFGFLNNPPKESP